ncbi:hypothetical protein PG997_005732 [Apiospora hydei]|uniref:Uncharacterized protein n=1 Tax=Apiospora hydei TaxID=1337664 RepID=A0ABR1WLP3_9PEZI
MSNFYYPYGDYQPRGVQDFYTTNQLPTPMDLQGSAHYFNNHVYNPAFGWPVQYNQGYPGPEMQLPFRHQGYEQWSLEDRGVPRYPCVNRGIW